MWGDPDKLFLTTAIIAVVCAVITGLVWFFLRDHPASETRFRWNQYSRDFIRTEYTDRHNAIWVVDIKYRSSVIMPSCREDGHNNLTLIIPEGFPVKDFELFIKNCRKVNSTGHRVLAGFVDIKALSRLHFNAIDRKVFGDFKKTIYQKALTQ